MLNEHGISQKCCSFKCALMLLLMQSLGYYLFIKHDHIRCLILMHDLLYYSRSMRDIMIIFVLEWVPLSIWSKNTTGPLIPVFIFTNDFSLKPLRKRECGQWAGVSWIAFEVQGNPTYVNRIQPKIILNNWAKLSWLWLSSTFKVLISSYYIRACYELGEIHSSMKEPGGLMGV